MSLFEDKEFHYFFFEKINYSRVVYDKNITNKNVIILIVYILL